MYRGDIDRWRDEIADLKSRIAALREKIARAELDVIELTIAANILDEMGLSVGRNEDGHPHVSVERGPAAPPVTKADDD